MTIIASFEINGIPCILGDLLISTMGIPAPSVHLPTAGEVAEWFPIGSNIYPSGMLRKLCFIKNIGFGWSGNVESSKEIITNLQREILLHGDLTMERLEEIISSLPGHLRTSIDNGSVSFTGYLINPVDNEPHHFSFNSSFINSPYLENLHVSGSGSEIFINNLSLINKNVAILNNDQILGEINPWDDAVEKVLSLSGRLLHQEMYTRENIRNYFGGGYDIAFISDGKFHIFGNIVYFFWWIDMKNGDINNIGITPIIIKVHNHNDILITRTFQLGEPEPNDSSMFYDPTQKIFYVGPINRDVSKEEFRSIPDPDLSGNILCSIIHLNWLDKYMQIPIIDPSINGTLPISFVKKDGRDAFKIDKEYIQRILDTIHKYKGISF